MTKFETELKQYLNKCDPENNFFRSNKPYNYDSQEFEMACVDNYGGEGEGEVYWKVWKFTKGSEEVHVQFDGSYASYNGSTYDDWFFVEPREVTVTQYFKKAD